MNLDEAFSSYHGGNGFQGPPWVIYVCEECRRPTPQGRGSGMGCPSCDYRECVPVVVVPHEYPVAEALKRGRAVVDCQEAAQRAWLDSLASDDPATEEKGRD